MNSNNTYLNIFKRVTHHSDQHVYQNNNNNNVVESKQKDADGLNNRGCMLPTRKCECIFFSLI